MFLKGWVKAILKSMGWRLIKVAPDDRPRGDPHFDQQVLFRGKPVNVIFDVGANMGQSAMEYRRRFPDATIYSFEPFEDCFNELCNRAAADAKIKPHQAAVSRESGTQKLFVNKSHYTNSLLPVAPEATQFNSPDTVDPVTQLEVTTITLDDFAAREKIERIDILKIDVQGGELLVLEGARGLLERGAIAVIFCEVDFAPLYENQAEFEELLVFLKRRGFVLYGLYNFSYRGNSPLIYGDAIFISAQVNAKLRG